jgi:hypothetical protein
MEVFCNIPTETGTSTPELIIRTATIGGKSRPGLT